MSSSRLSLLLLAGVTLAGCADEGSYARLYHAEPLPPSWEWDRDVASMAHMGPTFVDNGVNFCVYSERAERIELAFFDDPESTQPAWQVEMTPYDDRFYNVYVEGVGRGQHYGYIAWGPNWTWSEDPAFYPYSTVGFEADVDLEGNRFNPNKLLTDPWAKAYHRPHDWSKGSVASGPWRDDSTYAAGSKSVILGDEEDYTWSENEQAWRDARASGQHEGHGWNDLVVYEVHPKGLTADSASGVEHTGTFRGIGEMASYFDDLGITAVELMPTFMKETSLGGYWGYAPLSWFAPEVRYSDEYLRTGEVFDVRAEFKEMVDRLHQSGVEVILDVVYNHTGEGGWWETSICPDPDPTNCYNVGNYVVTSQYSFRGLDNAAWYYLTEDGAKFINSSGGGNDVRANSAHGQQIILDSLHYFVEEMHVDGFRFDLAAELAASDADYTKWDAQNSILNRIVNDEVLRANNTRIIAEPWSMQFGDGGGRFPASTGGDYAFGEWNGGFRDFWKEFINKDVSLNTKQYYDNINAWEAFFGSPSLFQDSGRKPYHSVNYVASHDGWTLYDMFSFDQPVMGCSPVNPVCCNDAYSVWCKADEYDSGWYDGNRAKDWGYDGTCCEEDKRQMARNAFTAVFLAHGTPMILGGDEWLRTQYGNVDAYSEQADNEYNWLRWGEWTGATQYELHRMHDYVRKLAQFRREHAYALAPLDWDAHMPASWKGTNGQDLSSDGWNGRVAMIHYYKDGEYQDKEIAILINGTDSDQAFTLPSGRSWGRVIDTQSYFDLDTGFFADKTGDELYDSANIVLNPQSAVGTTYTASGRTMVVLVEL